MNKKTEFPYVYRHLSGDNPCGGDAFYLTKKPIPGERASTIIFRHLNGREFVAGIMVRCDSCGNSVGGPNTKDIFPNPQT